MAREKYGPEQIAQMQRYAEHTPLDGIMVLHFITIIARSQHPARTGHHHHSEDDDGRRAS